MLQIKKLRADHVLDFAAEELKKYLRMMMPEGGDVEILYHPGAADGFRLGLLEDFGLESEARDPVLDDVIHVDTQASGGILAGSNPRSVLFAVYRLLRENGCRWLYPGVDGEHIPVKDLEPVCYHKLADHRFRGHCNEGAESQTCMLETIDFFAKQELNVYMIEFDNPFTYYNAYYSHENNVANRPPEPVTRQQVKQWKRQCEVEIAKRGLQLHDMGHGWTAEPFGISSVVGWKAVENQDFLTPQQRQALAQVKGVRELYGGVALNTNLCMSNPRVRQTVVRAVADYARDHGNVDYLHVWLADSTRNHCECDECVKMLPSDYYMMMMNELDEELTRRGLATRIVFICYVDTVFAPQKVRIANPERFSLLYAPITRVYTESYREDAPQEEPIAYVRNNWRTPKTMGENAALLKAWLKTWQGPTFSYEYHFWRHQYLDPGLMAISRRIYEDVRSLKAQGVDGYVEDGSQRSFFPNGWHMYIYAQTLMDRECDYEEALEDYFFHIYGEDWPQVRQLLEELSQCFDQGYLSGQRSEDPDRGAYYAPGMVQRLQRVEAITRRQEALAKKHLSMPTRPQTVSYRLLLRHGEYCRELAPCLIEKALGNDALARELGTRFRDRFGRHEWELERYFDHYMCFRALSRILELPTDTFVPGE